jgi:hypothetical protein
VWQTHHASEILEINGAWAALTQIIANPDIHCEALVLDACEFLRTYGDWMDHEHAKVLHAAIIRDAIAGLNRKGSIRRWLTIAGDVIGAAHLFGILYLFLLFTPS